MRRVAVLTGTRADYGLLRGLLREIDADPELDLRIIVTGTHLIDAFGRTETEIVADGLPIAASVPIWSEADTRSAVAADVGRALPRYAEALIELEPDVLVVLGDRLEAFAAAAAATILSIPIAHIHGGELTEGAMDDALRHSLTKMAYLHFTSTEDHRRRVIQLGEEPGRVHFHGAPIVDALNALELLPREQVAARFGIRLPKQTALVTFHPAVMDVESPEVLLDELLAGLLDVDGLHIVITGSNSDIGTADVRRRIGEFVAAHPERVDFVESFGQVAYLSVMAAAAVVAGNSSSTVLEAPVLGIPSVLIGDRQKGRPVSASVASPSPDRGAIADAVRVAISSPASVEGTAIFGGPGFAALTTQTLRDSAIPRPPRKRFHDLEEKPHS
ncbi:UDP-N-acetylglucosamine 2-epimerase [Microbacterium sp. W4I20]|uniref:UDP-N-acetylglucosamine 2-epimerase n=1 Tax=Microbacterium sp. W4I20 TaxID=3042262 RepID=UPI002784A036|nr:UDP-N-acetylglucosamine 2-epimerase [Microbacterium sp. W4I20]MDQ0725947.1 UDP-hydrolyzing UDP-N-acetyl-D-glucosamine 2-epimerase [Microbacterium sp. W4I20]